MTAQPFDPPGNVGNDTGAEGGIHASEFQAEDPSYVDSGNEDSLTRSKSSMWIHDDSGPSFIGDHQGYKTTLSQRASSLA
jgi:hypothetical protein